VSSNFGGIVGNNIEPIKTTRDLAQL